MRPAVNPNCAIASAPLPEAPNQPMPITRPSAPTYRHQDSVASASTATRRRTARGSTLSRQVSILRREHFGRASTPGTRAGRPRSKRTPPRRRCPPRNRSRANLRGLAGLRFRKSPHNARAMSAISSGAPGCPESARCTASLERARMASASSRRVLHQDLSCSPHHPICPATDAPQPPDIKKGGALSPSGPQCSIAAPHYRAEATVITDARGGRRPIPMLCIFPPRLPY